VHTGFWWEHLRERDSLEKQDVDLKITLQFSLKVIGYELGVD
jgi:hypothetical protein